MERLNELEGQIIQLMMYYHHELKAQGIVDRKQYLATMIPKWIQLSEAQLGFIEKELDIAYYHDMINEMSLLLKTLPVSSSDDQQTLKIIIKCLSQLQSLFKGSE